MNSVFDVMNAEEFRIPNKTAFLGDQILTAMCIYLYNGNTKRAHQLKTMTQRTERKGEKKYLY